MVETSEDLDILIKVDQEYFVREIDGNTISCTRIPSAAFHTTYAAADRICRTLRRRHYPYAHATDIFGNPVTENMLRPPRIADSRSTVQR